MIPQVFSAAREVDQAFVIILAIAVGILVLVTVLMLYFLWRYHYTRNPEATEIPGSLALELLWTVIPSILVMAMFWFGWSSFKAMRTVPAGALEVSVEARMWSWSFGYPGGKRSPVLMAPVATDVKLSMTSRDVIHSFYVPAMRIKMDTVPGMTTTAWFNSDQTGEFDILCAEYCGLKHANMITTLKIVTQREYYDWLAGKDEGTAKARALFESYGCTSCHSLDGAEGVGPPLAGLGGRMVEVLLPGGKEQVVASDEAYLRRAVLDPEAEIVQGYAPTMPPFEGVVSDEDLAAMVNWMLFGDTAGQDQGRALAEAEGCVSCHSTDGSIIAGPSFRGLFGSRRSVVDAQGAQSTVLADEAYVRQSIVQPEALLVEGQDPIMPPYESLDEAQLALLVDYLRALAAPAQDGPTAGAAPAAPEKVPAQAPGTAADVFALEGEGCLGCHSLDGSTGMGPSFKGLFGRLRTVAGQNGAERVVIADETYVRESITTPQRLVTQGFGPMMPAYDGLPEQELSRLVDAVKALGAEGGK